VEAALEPGTFAGVRLFALRLSAFAGAFLLVTLALLGAQQLTHRRPWVFAGLAVALLLGFVGAATFARLGRWRALVFFAPLIVMPPVGATAELRLALPAVALGVCVCLGTVRLVAGGAACGALTYGLLWDPFGGLGELGWLWAALYLVFLGATILAEPREVPSPKAGRARWVLLAAGPSALTFALMNVLARERGEAPTWWLLPLAVTAGAVLLATVRRRTGAGLWAHAAVLTAALATIEVDGLWLVLAAMPLTFAASSLLLEERAHGVAPIVGVVLGAAVGALPGWEVLAAVGISAVAMAPRVEELSRPSRWVLGGVLALSVAFAVQGRPPSPRTSAHARYRVVDEVWRGARVRTLEVNGSVRGRQRLVGIADGARLHPAPIGAHHAAGPLGSALRSSPRPRDVGVVGLGAGAVAAHLGDDETATFYARDPLAEELARTRFDYLREHDRVLLGSPRSTLREHDVSHDVLVLDLADAIETELLTAEAFALYRRRVRERGVILVRAPQRVDLRPRILAAARAAGWRAALASPESTAPLEEANTWIGVASRERVAALAQLGWTPDALAPIPRVPAWTDGRRSVLSAWLRAWLP